jgi:hypothetical protein
MIYEYTKEKSEKTHTDELDDDILYGT